MNANSMIKHARNSAPRAVTLRKVGDSAPAMVVDPATPSVDAVTGPFVRAGLVRNSPVALRVTFRAMARRARA